MSNVLQRIITGSIFITVIIFSLWYSLNATFIVMGLFLFLGLLEFFKLFKNEKSIQLNSIFNAIALFTIYCIIGYSLSKFEPQFSILTLPILSLRAPTIGENAYIPRACTLITKPIILSVTSKCAI